MSQVQHSNGRTSRQSISPRARRLLRERNINPATIVGTGPSGRIVEADITHTASTPLAVSQPSAELSTMRRAIVRATTASAAIPQFAVQAELDASSLVSLRQQLLDPIQADAGIKLSITDFLLLAQARALADLPRANAVWRNDSIEQLATVNVGLVVAVEDGLLLPVIGNADRLSLVEMARRRSEVISAARAGRQLSDTSSPPATSLSNLGHSRVDGFTALVMPPQCTMLAIGRLAPRPFVVNGQLTVRPTLRLSLSADHRVLDGTQAAELLTRIVEYLEQPARLLHQELRPYNSFAASPSITHTP